MKDLIPVEAVVVPEGRYRGATGDMAGLAESLKRFGQLVPIIVSDKNELVAGFRRLTAAKALKWTLIWVVYQESITPLLHKEIELEENLQREQITWQEKVRALAQLDALKRQLDPNWSQGMTAQVAGTEQSRVAEAIQLTRMMQIFPELANAKSIHQAQSWALTKAASVVRLKEVRDNRAEFQEIEEKILLGDSVEAIKLVPSGQFRLVLTDPPFGIGYDKRQAGVDQAVTAYKDDEESYRRLLGMAEDLYRVLLPDGWLVWFLGPTWYERAKVRFREAGFTVDEIPIIWYRRGGRAFTSRPDRYFGRIYDMALHCIKGDPEIIGPRSQPNVIEAAPIEGGDRDLLVERPVELYQELIKRLTIPGETVADFFVGSGSVPAAAASLKRNYWGCELDPARRAVALKKIKAWTV